MLSIQVGLPKTYHHEEFPDDQDRDWSSGIFKYDTAGPVMLGNENFEGDGQADLRFHGGPDRAVLIFPKLNYPHWERELGRELEHGAFGENLTVDEPDEDVICLGDVWESDSARLEVSQPRLPCFKLARRLGAKGINVKVMNQMAGGWYSRVLQQGAMSAGDELRLVDRPFPAWTIRRAFREFVFGRQNDDVLAELTAIPALSELWKTQIAKRLSGAEDVDG